jgi:LysM repeat protein
MAVAAVLVVGTLAALVLLVTRPRLPSEHPSVGAAPTAAATAPSAAGGGTAPAGAAPAASATPAAPSTTYIIAAGDTVNAIAARNGVSSEAIVAANPGIDPGALQIGQQITIPAH